MSPPESSAPFSSGEITGQRSRCSLNGRARARTSFWDTETKMLRPKSPDRCLLQTQSMSLEPVDGNEARASGERRTKRTNVVREDRRQGTSSSIDNRGADRCWAAVRDELPTKLVQWLHLKLEASRRVPRPLDTHFTQTLRPSRAIERILCPTQIQRALRTRQMLRRRGYPSSGRSRPCE